tara:strand:- start:619 stop:849 length:231 start_codon:yes stop_codon:yes gene_type:complete
LKGKIMKTVIEQRYYLTGKHEGELIERNYFIDNDAITDDYWYNVAKRNENPQINYSILHVFDPDFGVVYNEAGDMV